MFITPDIYYVSEKADWVIKQEGMNIKKNLQNMNMKVVTSPPLLGSAIIHYGSFNSLLDYEKYNNNHNKSVYIASCFHIVDGDPRIARIPSVDMRLTKWHTSCNITKNKLIRFGVNEEKIELIPLGVDIDTYRPLDDFLLREYRREKIGIKREDIVIGYFQKDGNGWGDGDEPKLIKGPDIFCDVVEKLAEKYSVFVLLSGPARGYVKKRLREHSIPFYHKYLERPMDVVSLYQLCDVYMVTSREEGGPKAILESMACGVPIISTKVGMAPDVIKDGENGFLCEIESVEGLIDSFERVVNSEVCRKRIIEGGLITSKKYDYSILVEEYEMRLYKNRGYE